jgi:hypothetical protein
LLFWTFVVIHLPLPPPGRRGLVVAFLDIRGYSPPPAPSWKEGVGRCSVRYSWLWPFTLQNSIPISHFVDLLFDYSLLTSISNFKNNYYRINNGQPRIFISCSHKPPPSRRGQGEVNGKKEGAGGGEWNEGGVGKVNKVE